MTWNAAPTAVAGAAIPYTWWNTYVRDNLNETAPAKATITANATHFVGNGVNSIAQREVKYDTIDTSGTTASTAYTDLGGGGGVGPSVTITTGTFLLVCQTAQMSNGTAAKYCASSFETPTTSANDSAALVSASATAGDQFRGTVTTFLTATPGSNTYTAKYKVEAGTGTFLRRRLVIMAF